MVTLLTTSFFLATFRSARNLVYLWCAGVVAQEPPKLATQHTFDQIFLVQPYPTLAHFLHERSYLALVHLHTLDVVYHVIKLLGTDFFGFWHRAFLELLLNGLLHLTDLAFLACMDNANTRSFLSSTTCSTTTMGVVLHIVRHPIIDNMSQVIHIQTTSSHIGSHQ